MLRPNIGQGDGCLRRSATPERVCHTCAVMAGIGRNDVLQVGYGYGLFTGGLGLHYGAENLGAMVIPMSTISTAKQLDMMEDLGTTAIACTPSYLVHLMDVLREGDRLDRIKLRAAICGAEPWTEEMRERLEQGLNITVHDIYGLSEIMGPGVAADCSHHLGNHIFEDHFLPEILDPTTLENLPPGEIGELTITTLTKEALPLIRFRTKDLTSIDYTTCDCGRTMARVARFTGRSDDMLIIRGVNVFPSQIEAALLSMGDTTPHYHIEVDRVNDQDVFIVHVEVDASFFSDEVGQLENLSKRIAYTLRHALGVTPIVRLVQPSEANERQE